MVSDVLTQPDAALEMTLRPSLFSRFHRPGQGQGTPGNRPPPPARQRGEALDHILLSGPPGLGKTTIATFLAKRWVPP